MPTRLIKDPVRYKTVLCEKFLSHGECPYGHRCQFAHGTDELRKRDDTRTKEKKPRRGRAAAAAEIGPSEVLPPSPARADSPAAASSSASALEVQPPAAEVPAQLPPALEARKAVTWREVVASHPPPSPSSPSGSLPSPSTPPKLAPRGLANKGLEAETPENESPQAAAAAGEPICGACEPLVLRSESGTHPKLGINSVTGKVEVTRVGRQLSHNTNSVRRQLSLLFEDDDDDESPPTPTSSAIWRHDHFGMPAP